MYARNLSIQINTIIYFCVDENEFVNDCHIDIIFI